jgi:hypothetical protein
MTAHAPTRSLAEIRAEELQMPKVSKDSAEHVDQHGPVEDRHEEIDGYTVNFVSFGVDIDGTPLLKGLPGEHARARTGATC